MCSCVFNKLYICVLLRISFGLYKATLKFAAFSHTTQNARFLNFSISLKLYCHYSRPYSNI